MRDEQSPPWHKAVLGLDGIVTPTSFLCAPQARRNIETQAAMAAATGASVVPHFKGHRLRQLAELQIATGSTTIEASRLTDIVQLFRLGLDCNFALSWCWDRPTTWETAAALVVDGASLSVDVDSIQLAKSYAQAARAKGVVLGVRVQVDSGLRGIEPEHVPALVHTIIDTDGLRLDALTAYRGIYTPDQAYLDRSPDELGQEETQLLLQVAESLGANATDVGIVAGSSLTSRGVASVPGVTGVAGGTYAIGDITQALLGFCDPAAIAVATMVSVVETNGTTATVDGGTRDFGTLSHYPIDIPGIRNAATVDGRIVVTEADAHQAQVEVLWGDPLGDGERLLLLPCNASAFAAKQGAVMVVDDDGNLTDVWARITNDIRIGDPLI